MVGNVIGKNKVKLARVVNTASKLIGNDQKQLSSIYKEALKRKSTHILSLIVPLAKKNLFKKYFVPSAILILNAK